MPKLQRLLIVGAGGFGREVHSWLMHIPPENRNWYFGGFLDDKKRGDHIVSTIYDYKSQNDDVLCCGMGDPKTKKKVYLDLLDKNCNFYTLIHPSVIIGDNVQLGKGCILCPNVVITCNVNIGDFTTINVSSSVGHDASIGRWSTISGHCDITGFASLEEGVFLGSGARIIPEVQIGAFSKIGAGSVVTRKVEANKFFFGNPATEIMDL